MINLNADFDESGKIQSTLVSLNSGDKRIVYKKYIDGVEKLLNKHYKYLNKQLKDYITFDYNEVIINQYKIIRVCCIEHEQSSVIQEIKSLGLKYGGVKTWNEISKIK
jgi:hypothetical protein